MRPPAIEKMGFYETTTDVADLLKTYFKPAETGRLLDPCAGEGTAASILTKALNCQSWGAELSPARAALASEKMDRISLHASYRSSMTDKLSESVGQTMACIYSESLSVE